MSGYEEEHDIKPSAAPAPYRRPDLSTFFSTLDLIDTSHSDANPHHNANATPIPANISSAFRQLANSYQIMLGETEGVAPLAGQHHDHASNELLESMIGALMANANDPPTRPKGMDEEFFDCLERVPKTALKKGDACPICSVPFLEDQYPLVVQLPCHKSHMFDMECIRPWLKLNTTCPLDRVDLAKKKEPVKPVVVAEEEEEYDDMYA